MSWSVLQSAGVPMAFGTDIEASTVTLGSNCSAGSVLIAYVNVGTFGATSEVIVSVKDGAGNSMTHLASAFQTASGNACDISVWAMATPAGDVGTKPTFTATSNAPGSYPGGQLIQEVSGIQAVLDGTAGTATGTTNPATMPAYSSSAANEYLVCLYGDQAEDGQTMSGAGGSWTTDAHSQLTGNAGGAGPAVQYKNSTGGSESGGTWNDSVGAGVPWAVIAAAFKLTGGAAVTPFFPKNQPARSRIPSPYALGRPGLLYVDSL
jgi:hypothetical protein